LYEDYNAPTKRLPACGRLGDASQIRWTEKLSEVIWRIFASRSLAWEDIQPQIAKKFAGTLS
jgi:hypothetical protein